MNCKKVLGWAALSLLTFLNPSNEAFAQKKGKWISLFDGKTFTGWETWKKEGISPKWQVQDGALVLTEKGGGDLMTTAQYGDFELELEWKISEAGNSGIMYHVQKGEKYCCPYSTGPEMQVLDDAKHPDSFKGASGNHKAGSLYDMLPPTDLKAVKPAGEWNKARLIVKDGKAQHWLNGKKVLEYPTKGPEWDALVAKSKFAGWDGFGKFDKGHIAFQDHGDKVWYRKIRLMEL